MYLNQSAPGKSNLGLWVHTKRSIASPVTVQAFASFGRLLLCVYSSLIQYLSARVSFYSPRYVFFPFATHQSTGRPERGVWVSGVLYLCQCPRVFADEITGPSFFAYASLSFTLPSHFAPSWRKAKHVDGRTKEGLATQTRLFSMKYISLTHSQGTWLAWRTSKRTWAQEITSEKVAKICSWWKCQKNLFTWDERSKLSFDLHLFGVSLTRGLSQVSPKNLYKVSIFFQGANHWLVFCQCKLRVNLVWNKIAWDKWRI
jgi:hypothetical protein